ncbi:hypothetical protein E3U23_00025 [Erythrobacter litoralis]|uniref:hypothetical protein n=1 Tax=Erythrobacter litoralis TaxID=39960 RepID=UPI002435F201|nr:hypothetical protein [Erythrobacter litoralis]MDG6077583.1 hypothetical protein [Erythrobacter litoralis]
MPAIEPITALMALAFCAVHLFVAKLRFLDTEPRSRWLSFAGGVAVAYVFLHILPELGAHGTTFERALGIARGAAEAWVYTLALAGLALFYGVERAVVTSRGGRERGDGRRPGSGVFWLHIAANCLLIFIISYLLNHREDATVGGLVLFFVALLLHFVTADFASRADHPEIYDSAGRWALVAATLGGWITGLFVELPQIVIGCLFAFVGGAMVLVILKEELPEERESRFLPFLLGATIYAALVIGEFYVIE